MALEIPSCDQRLAVNCFKFALQDMDWGGLNSRLMEFGFIRLNIDIKHCVAGLPVIHSRSCSIFFLVLISVRNLVDTLDVDLLPAVHLPAQAT